MNKEQYDRIEYAMLCDNVKYRRVYVPSLLTNLEWKLRGIIHR